MICTLWALKLFRVTNERFAGIMVNLPAIHIFSHIFHTTHSALYFAFDSFYDTIVSLFPFFSSFPYNFYFIFFIVRSSSPSAKKTQDGELRLFFLPFLLTDTGTLGLSVSVIKFVCNQAARKTFLRLTVICT